MTLSCCFIVITLLSSSFYDTVYRAGAQLLTVTVSFLSDRVVLWTGFVLIRFLHHWTSGEWAMFV